MGTPSGNGQEQRGERTEVASSPAEDADVPRTPGEEALGRLLRTNTPRKLSLAGAYALGYGLLGHAQRQGTDPYWHQAIDPLDALFLGAAGPDAFDEDPCAFANARDAWLRILRGTVHGQGIQRFVRLAVSTAGELGRPVDDGNLMLALVGRVEAAGLDQRGLPRRLLPAAALPDRREVLGPSFERSFPDPPEDAGRRVERFWKRTAEESGPEDTPQAVLREGLRRFEDLGLPVRKDSGTLLPALYSALLANPGEPLEVRGPHAFAWALSLDETSPLAPVLDLLVTAPEREMSVAETLGRLFALPAFTEPIPPDALLWTSSPGLALPRLAFELGITKVPTRNGEITQDLLDAAGTRTRIRLTPDGGEGEPEDGYDVDTQSSDPEGEWDERRAAVRDAVLRKTGKKSRAADTARRPAGPPVERVWNADGSSVVRFSTDTPHGQLLATAIQQQRTAFREKFGREPGPDDPLFFDPDADEPAPLTKEHFDGLLREMAGHADGTGIDPAFLYAWRKVGYLVTEENRDMFTIAEAIAFGRAVARYRRTGE
ncbi:hypothetical protein JNUCC64_14265 [Streptomyces sp. JNUCC 64]